MANTTLSFGGILLLIFITLKLCKVIAWSWWWVFAPMWMPLVAFAVIVIFAAIFYALQFVVHGE